MSSILPIPELPDGIREAVNANRLAVFVGAGASRVMGCMGWDQLARNLVSACYENGYVNYKEMETLLKEPDHRKTITIAHHIMAEKENSELFYSMLGKALQPDENLAQRYPIYKELCSLRAVMVTTNADELLTGFYNPDAVLWRPEQLSGTVDPTKLYHIHGSIRDRRSIVFRLEEYIRLYNHSNVKAFLKTLFKDYTILFVGYGLNELELLEYLVTTNDFNRGIQRQSLQHYYLMPLFAGEENILWFQQAYFGNLNIEVIGYDMTQNGYAQLFDVVQSWQREIRRVTSSLTSSFEVIENAVSGFDEETAAQVFQLIRNDQALENHFFRNVSGPEWLTSLQERGYFDPVENPAPLPVEDKPGFVWIPGWNVMGYLERVAGQILQEDPERWEELLAILRSVSDYRDAGGRRIQNFRTDWSITKILARIPAAHLESADLDRVLEFLQQPTQANMVGAEIGTSLVPHILSSGRPELVDRLIEVVLANRWQTSLGREEAEALIEEYWFIELLKKHLDTMCSVAPLVAARTALRLIEEILARDNMAFHIVAVPNVGDVDLDTGFRSYEKTLVRVARDALAGAAAPAVNETSATVRDLFGKPHPILKRIAIYVIADRWEALADLFWELADQTLFGHTHIAPELRHLAANRFAGFTDEQKRRWVEWIEAETYGQEVDRGEEAQRYIARQKVRHLYVIKDSGFQPARELYDQYVRLIGVEPREEDLQVVSGPVRMEPETSDITQGFAKLEIPALLEVLSSSQMTESPFEVFEVEQALENVVEAAPDRFVAHLPAFAAVVSSYKAPVLSGLKRAWKSGHAFDWNTVLGFCLEQIQGEAFWKQFGGDRGTRNFVEATADLILDGTANNDRAFADELLPAAQEILLVLLDRTPPEVGPVEDVEFRVLNSPRGRVLRAIVSLSLRFAHVNRDRPSGERWSREIREQFTQRLDYLPEEGLEFPFTLGNFLPHFYFLDKDWVTANFERIFVKEHEDAWKAAFGGHLLRATFYPEFFDLFRGAGHYEKALDTHFGERHVSELLVQHIVLAYLGGKESLDDGSLISRVLERWDKDELRGIVTFLWMQRDKEVEPQVRERVLLLWEKLVDRLQATTDLSADEKGLAALLSRLAAYLSAIDDRSQRLLKLSATYSGAAYETPFFVEELDRLADASPRQAAEVYIEMLESEVFPDYDMAHIRSCIEKVYAAGEQDLGSTICNLYMTRGFEQFRELFEAHNPIVRDHPSSPPR